MHKNGRTYTTKSSYLGSVKPCNTLNSSRLKPRKRVKTDPHSDETDSPDELAITVRKRSTEYEASKSQSQTRQTGRRAHSGIDHERRLRKHISRPGHPTALKDEPQQSTRRMSLSENVTRKKLKNRLLESAPNLSSTPIVERTVFDKYTARAATTLCSGGDLDLHPERAPKQTNTIATGPDRTDSSLLKSWNQAPDLKPEATPTHANWDIGLEYKTSNERRAVLRYEDLQRLGEGEMLNDNVIDYLLAKSARQLSSLHPETSKRTHWFNTWFYPGLWHAAKFKRPLDYHSVSKWTKGIELWSKDYLIIPVHEEAHWYLVIVCNLAKLAYPLRDSAESSQRTPSIRDVEPGDRIAEDDTEKRSKLRRRKTYPLETTAIIVLDSLDGEKHYDTIQILKGYLRLQLSEAKADIKWHDRMVQGIHAPDLPKQNNWWDCGIYMLGYLHAFAKDPGGFVADILDARIADSTRWDFLQADQLRTKWRDIIEEDHKKFMEDRSVDRHD